MLKIICCCFLPLFFLVGATCQSAQKFQDFMKKIPPTIEKAATKEKIPASPYNKLLKYNVALKQTVDGNITCSGTVIQSDEDGTLILTAYHCVDDVDANPVEYGFIDDQNEIYRFEVDSFSRKNDLALLLITDDCPIFETAEISDEDVNLLDAVLLVGNPAGKEDILSKGSVSKLDMVAWGDNTPVHLIDTTSWYGGSGGALYSSDFKLLGVLIQFGPQAGAQTGWMYTVKFTAIQKFLEENL